ncbi:nuclear transport factor 2 family protein [Xanthomonas sp. WHRI 7945]|nr:nuclear transport factor 2 family protein [Xanthomonas campestris pv. campestris]
MNALNLPEPIAAYFQADTQDGQAVARCFTPNGSVRDESKTHQGQAAIEAWKADTSTRYTYTTEPRTLQRDGERYIVTGHVAGDFPGSPVDLRYVFTLERGRIASLEIAP